MTITIDRAVLEKALHLIDLHLAHHESGCVYLGGVAILSLREALNAPQPEPVIDAVHQWRKQGCANWYDGHPDNSDGGGPYETRTLYTAPPRREWFGLTVGDISKAWDRQYVQIPLPQPALNFARDIEQALKERNHE